MSRCVGFMQEKDEEKLGSCGLENGSFSYLVGYLEGEESDY